MMLGTSLLPLAFGGLVVYFIVQSVYRLYFHPLSKIPGPKLAALSRFYEFYYDVVKGGMFLWEIEKMHKQYGEDSYLQCAVKGREG